MTSLLFLELKLATRPQKTGVEIPGARDFLHLVRELHCKQCGCLQEGV